MFDTRQNVQYGWQSKPVQRSSEVIELPMAPVRRITNGAGAGTQCHGCQTLNWYTFGIFLSIISAASLALGVADVVVTYKTYMEGKDCKTYISPSYCADNNLVWTWVGSGIWGSLPVFIFGVYSICKASRPNQQGSCFDYLAFVSAFVFTPAIIVLSAIEVYKGSNVYYWTAPDLSQDDLVKAIIPIVIAGLGFIEHIMTAVAFFTLCCCANHASITYGTTGQAPVIRAPTQQINWYQQGGAYDRTQTQPANGMLASPYNAGQSASFYAPTRTSSYNQFNSGPSNQCGGGFKQCSPNPAYNYYR